MEIATQVQFFQNHYLNIYFLPGYCSWNFQCGPTYNLGVQGVKIFLNNTKLASMFLFFTLSIEYDGVFQGLTDVCVTSQILDIEMFMRIQLLSFRY